MENITLSQAFSHRFKKKPHSPKSYSVPELIGKVARIEVIYPLEWYTDPESVRIESGEMFGTIIGVNHSINIENTGTERECRRYYASIALQGCYFNHINEIIPMVWTADLVNELPDRWFGSEWYIDCQSDELLRCTVHLL